MTPSYPFGGRTSLRTTFLVGLGGLAVFAIVPSVGVVGISFTDIRGFPGIPIHWLGGANYTALLSPAHLPDNLDALQHTLVFAGFSTAIQIILALGIAVLLNQNLVGRNLYRAVI